MEILKTRLSPEIYESLVKGNIDSLKTILTTNSTLLSQRTKLNSEATGQVIKVAAEIIVADKIKTASDVPEWNRITTGCNAINALLNGGIPLNGIVEVVGSSGVGKTQFCLQLSLTVQFPASLGGLNKGAVYICTEDVFPSKRLHQLSRVFAEKHKNNYMDNIYIEHIVDFEQLRRCVFVHLPILLQRHNVGLIIIDSMAGIFRFENADVDYSNRSQEFLSIASQLSKLGTANQIAVICTNQVTQSTKTSDLEPCLGLAWTNLLTCRFSIQRECSSPIRTFKIIFAPDLRSSSCQFIVDRSGLNNLQNL